MEFSYIYLTNENNENYATYKSEINAIIAFTQSLFAWQGQNTEYMNDFENFTYKLSKAISKVTFIDNRAFSTIKAFSKIETLKEGEFYSYQNDYLKRLSFICVGVLRLFYCDAEGQEWNKHFATENDFIASNTELDTKNTFSVQALTPVVLISIPIYKLLEIEQTGTFVQKLKSAVIERMQKREFALLSMDAKNMYLDFKKNFPDLENQISHYQIASYLGITPTQLSRIRKNIAS